MNDILRTQDEALNGMAGGKLMAVSVSGGEFRQEIPLDSLPVWDGMAVASGSLFVATQDGKVIRFGKK